jgi:hypothetical protein
MRPTRGATQRARLHGGQVACLPVPLGKDHREPTVTRLSCVAMVAVMLFRFRLSASHTHPAPASH